MMYGKEISWSYIEQFYLFDKDNEVRYAPKLTDDHINLPFNKKMKVNLVAQVLSHTVAAGICTLIRTGYFEEKLQQTAIFIKEIDSILNLYNEIQYEYLLTNRINQDSIENLFSIIRAKGGARDHPTPDQIRAAYRQVVFDNILMPSEGSNCIPDNDRLILSINNILVESSSIPPIMHHKYAKTIYLPDIDPKPKINIFAYMAGYLLKKHPIICAVCIDQLYNSGIKNNNLIFIEEKEYRKPALCYPSDDFLSIIELIEKEFLKYIDKLLPNDGLVTNITQQILKSFEIKYYIKCINQSCIDKYCNMLDTILIK